MPTLIVAADIIGAVALLAVVLLWPIAPDPVEPPEFRYRNVRRLTPKDIADYSREHTFFDQAIHDVEVW